MINEKFFLKLDNSELQVLHFALVQGIQQTPGKIHIDIIRACLLWELAQKCALKLAMYKKNYRFTITPAQAYALLETTFKGYFTPYQDHVLRSIKETIHKKAI